MGLKNFIFLFLILILAGLMIFQVSASDNVDYFNNSTEILFEGIDFMIPEGFGEYKASENYDELGSEGQTCFYINENHGEIVITVISDWMGISLDELKKDNATKTSVNGHDGWNYTDGNLHYFGYVKDDKGILVGVTNETRLYEIVI